MSLYDIRYNLKETRDGASDYEDTPRYGLGAVYGEKLDLLIADLVKEEETLTEWDKQLQEKAKLQKELDQLKEELAKAFMDGTDIQTPQGKRLAYPGLVVLYCSKGGPHYPAMVMEVCGFPQGKVGLRVFSRGGKDDTFKYALYRDGGELRIWDDTWRFID